MKKLILLALVLAGFTIASAATLTPTLVLDQGAIKVYRIAYGESLSTTKGDTSTAIPLLGVADSIRWFYHGWNAQAVHDTVHLRLRVEYAANSTGPWCYTDSTGVTSWVDVITLYKKDAGTLLGITRSTGIRYMGITQAHFIPYARTVITGLAENTFSRFDLYAVVYAKR